jgi:hypothetical protein
MFTTIRVLAAELCRVVCDNCIWLMHEAMTHCLRLIPYPSNKRVDGYKESMPLQIFREWFVSFQQMETLITFTVLNSCIFWIHSALYDAVVTVWNMETVRGGEGTTESKNRGKCKVVGKVELISEGVRKCMILLAGSQTSPACPHKGRIEMKTIE